MASEIKIPGVLAVGTGDHWGTTSGLKDAATGKMQSAINADVQKKYEKPAGGIPLSDISDEARSTFSADSAASAAAAAQAKTAAETARTAAEKALSDFNEAAAEYTQEVDAVAAERTLRLQAEATINSNINAVNRDVQNLVKEADTCDFSINDENGNAIAILNEGEIETKNFKSQRASQSLFDDSQSDLNIGDESGNVIAEFKDGHIKTKNFDSKNINLSDKKYIHFSFDDGEYCIQDIFGQSYTSVWSSPFFAMLKRLHTTYGAVFTINLFISTFSQITNKYSTELGAASDWLKWTLHGDSSKNYGASGTTSGGSPGGRTSGGQDWTDMVTAVLKLTGTAKAVDRHTRLSNFAGTEENLLAMKNQPFGAICFSAADDSRLSYNFDSNEASYCFSNEDYYESKTGLHFVPTFYRLDNSYMTDADKSNILSWIDKRNFSEFFMHEYKVFNSSKEIVKQRETMLDDFFSLMKNKGYINKFYTL